MALKYIVWHLTPTCLVHSVPSAWKSPRLDPSLSVFFLVSIRSLFKLILSPPPGSPLLPPAFSHPVFIQQIFLNTPKCQALS